MVAAGDGACKSATKKERPAKQRQVHKVPTGQKQRLVANGAAQLAKRDDRTGKRHRADQNAEEDFDFMNGDFDAAKPSVRGQIAGDADQNRGGTHEAVNGSRPVPACWSSQRARRPPHQSSHRRKPTQRAGQSTAPGASNWENAVSAVATIASSIPMMLNALPRRADDWVDRPPRLSMNRNTRRKIGNSDESILHRCTYLREHLEHARSDEEATRDVDG